MVKFTRELRDKKYITTVHVIPAMDINRIHRYPRPFVYHSEQFPELKEFNPTPTNYFVPQTMIADKNNKKFNQVKYNYRKIFKDCKEYDINELISTSKSCFSL
jgi:hypothetical protein